MDDTLDGIETASGVSRRADETGGEYLQRLADMAGAGEDLARTGFDPDADTDRELVRSFTEAVPDPGAIQSDDPDEPGHADSERSRRPGHSHLSRPFRGVTDYVFVAAIVLLAVHHLQNLGSRSLLRFDEGIYANAGKHMVTDGHWIVPRVGGYYFYETEYYPPIPGHEGLQPFLEKPPLVFWLQGLSMRVFGINEFAARFQSAAFGILTAVLIYVFARQVVDRRAGFLSAVVFLTSLGVMHGPNGPTHGATDMAVVFFLSLLTYLVWRGVRAGESRWLVYASVPAIGAVLSKGFDAGVAVVVLLPLLLVYPWMLFSRDAVKAVGVTVAVSSIWPLYAWHRYGATFVDIIFVRHVWDRVRQNSAGHEDALFEFMGAPFFRRFPVAFDPWAYLLVPAIAFLLVAYWWKRTGWKSRAALFVTWWFVSTFAFYVRFGRHLHYNYKAYVPAAILLGWFLRDVSHREPYARIALLTGILPLLLFSPRMESISPFTYVPSRFLWGSPLTGGEFVLLVVVSFVVLAYHPELQTACRIPFDRARHALPSIDRIAPPDRHYRVGKAVVSAVLVVAVAVALFGPPPIMGPHTSPDEEIGGVIDEETPEDATIHVTPGALNEARENYAAVDFYSDGRNLVGIGSPQIGVYDWMLTGDPDVRYVIATRGELDRVDDSEYRVIHVFGSDYWRGGDTKMFVEIHEQ